MPEAPSNAAAIEAASATPGSPHEAWQPRRAGRDRGERGAWSAGLRWMLIGFALSMPIHAAIVLWLAVVRVDHAGVPPPGEAAMVDMAFVPDADLPSTRVGAPMGGVGDGPALASSGALVTQMPTGAALEGGAGAGTGLADGGADGFGIFGASGGAGGGGGAGGAGGGGGGGGGLGGGAGGTSFFGVGGSGTRFAFIVDKSGSMSGGRLEEAKEELRKAIAALPDYASVYVVFFDSAPPWIFSDRWERVRSSTLQRLARWLRDVGPSGGTQPTPAFRNVFALDVRPDVIFFLSDGEIPPESVAEIRRLNARGKRVVVNAIAFGDEAGGAQLRQVAQDSDGEYREVKPRGPGARP